MEEQSLGAAERIVNALTAAAGHLVHNRPGLVTTDASAPAGIKWEAVRKHTPERAGQKFGRYTATADDVGKTVICRREGNRETRVGYLRDNGDVHSGAQVGFRVGTYRKSGIMPEVAVWMYKQIAEVWKLDPGFAARWASWAYARNDRDLKVMLCAFMLAQDKCGAPVIEDGEVLFREDIYDRDEKVLRALNGPFRG